MQIYLKSNNGAYESFMDYIKQILQHAQSFGSKSSILSVLAWIFGSILGSITLAGIFNAPEWLLIGLFSILVLLILAILAAFFYCLFTNKTDILRSEKYNIEKLAIEKQSSSDSLIDVHSAPPKLPNTINIIEPVQEDQ